MLMGMIILQFVFYSPQGKLFTICFLLPVRKIVKELIFFFTIELILY